ncbi:MAG: type II toxin-antitoxin system RelE/ParE family toxin [Xanthobacteraceae bacterium]|nr:type II toxin-antitoxin system RelE/ParE family toxin [Xanthobacteraceae bacterium]
MKLRFTPIAVTEIAAIADYLLVRNPMAAERVCAAIYDSLTNLLLFPLAGRRQKTDAVRKIVTSRYRYIIYYTFDESAEEIVVLNVKHPARERDHEDA